jgi:hypothetical protein
MKTALTGSQWAALWRLPLPGAAYAPKPRGVHSTTMRHLLSADLVEAREADGSIFYRRTDAGQQACVAHVALRQEMAT